MAVTSSRSSPSDRESQPQQPFGSFTSFDRRSGISSLEAVESNEQFPLALEGRSALEHPSAHRSAARFSPGVLLRACRPRQWSKNLLVLAAPCAAGVIDRPEVALQVAGAFVALCLLSSTTYLINDVRDREQDRLHPVKRMRPLAAGELSVRAAIRAALLMGLLGVALATAITPGLGVIGCGYLALTVSYSLWWRRIVVFDVLAIAAGFVLRALAGGVATDIYLSRWFVIVTASSAIFLVAAKRYAELRDRPNLRGSRATLRRYSASGLRLTLTAAATVAGAAYVSWAFTRPSHLVWYGLSIVPFLLCFARYAMMVGRGAGQAPEELLLRDKMLFALGVAWTFLFLGGVFVGR